MTMKFSRFVAVMMLVLCQAVVTQAALFNYNAAQIASARADGDFTIGTLFQVNTTQFITHLGAQDVDAASNADDPDGADGLTGFADDDGFFRDSRAGGAGISVGLWDATGSTLLGSVVVTSNDVNIGSWRYAPLAAPITLVAGTSYLIGANVGGGIEWFLDNGFGTAPFSAGPGITILQNRFNTASTLAAPLSDGGATLGRWAAANAIAIVPEPATASLALLGTLGLVLRRRRQA